MQPNRHHNNPPEALRIPTAEVFEPLLYPSRYKGAYGGRGSGKSHFFAGLLVERCLLQPTRAVCLREIQNSLKQSAKLLIEDKIKEYGLGSVFNIMNDRIVTPGGGLIIFQGMQNHTAESIKSLEGFDIAWLEEGQTISQTSLDLLRPTIRTVNSEIWVSWNPRFAKDPVDQLFRGKGGPPNRTILAEANFEDNPWFPDVLRSEMEYDKKRDYEKYLHVWRGKYKKASSAAVFRNWRAEVFETPDDARFYFGCDFGFASDPTVLIRMWIDGRTLYIDREAWAIGCEIDHTPALFAGSDMQKPARWQNPNGRYQGIPGATRWPIRADSANPQAISYLKRMGFNISPSIKGPGSVEEGVEFLKSYDIVIHAEHCPHVIQEFEDYSYEVDAQTDEILPRLADRKNHTIDSARYGLELVRRNVETSSSDLFGTYGSAGAR